ncbi:MFS transporter [Bogoriella caseilytica]|uniref:MFS transporter n=1 Tax=Bogoriella caseilytica TaxID=56055 RepID=A0A3N2BCK0_9MICO|nr:hypothetical protein EDD31_1358 [Bogoriella caseilytica]
MLITTNGRFRALWASHTLTFGANTMATLIFPVLVVADHASHDAAPAAIAFAFGLPWLLIGLPAGVWADRIQPRLLIVWSCLARAATLGTAAVLIQSHGGRSDITLTALAAGLGTTLVVQAVATQAAIPDLVEPEERQEANTWQFRATSVIELLSYIVAGLLTSGNLAIGLAAAAAASLSGAALATRISDLPCRHGGRPEVMAGFRALLGPGTTRQATVVTTVWRVSAGLGAALSVPYLLEAQQVRSGALGIAMAGVGVGAFLGSVTLGRISDKVPHTARLWRIMLTVGALGGIVRAVDYPHPAASAIAFSLGGVLIGVALSTTSILVITQRMNTVDRAHMGQAAAAFSILSWGAVPVGALIAAPMLATFGPELAFRVAALVLLLCPALSLLPPLGRRLEM